MLGTNDVNHKATFEANLRKIIELSLAQGVLPVLTTKADNLEGDQQINRTIAALAYEFDIPAVELLAGRPAPAQSRPAGSTAPTSPTPPTTSSSPRPSNPPGPSATSLPSRCWM